MQIHTEKTFEGGIEGNLLASGGWKQGDPTNFNAALVS
jgi:hypothetical protein